ncbi:dipeptide/oligopeptide/nickel ABC transporter permease/ATP-binding protein [Pseudonocardia sp. RS11V-5]|uniref:dipeptide/oligopeptide/nickel ABC transporter permease/ATP-binding protein n=1 Tax=Pseudonocardia terrae TaxID=2905831 RepID=UPI001E36521E|nr:dipeptide/oligopeptide/nickel ABC transporter permease/ATP-binding protein [Pseudonocardia terrae]MCE3555912.1 dipeptide/oligopeptide/nickel ABC transporter permease/ATP-binding protein [Pseudonocardia terrae]
MTLDSLSRTDSPTTTPPRRPDRPRRAFARRLLRSGSGAFSVSLLVLLVLACAGAAWLAPYDPLQNDLAHVLEGPSAAHLLGTDTVGRDVLSRLLFVGQPTFLGVAEALAVALLIGVPAGTVAGYFGGWFDAVISRVADIGMAIPAIVVLLMALAVFGQNQHAAMITLGVLFTPGLTRVARAAALATRNELYVAAARVAGLGHIRVMVRHILPRITNPIVVRSALLAGTALLVQSGLGFLGLGVSPPAPTWGGMVSEGSTVLQEQPWLIVPSGGVIAVTVLAFILLGDALRDAAQGGRSGLGTAGRRLGAAPQTVAGTVAGEAAPEPVPNAVLEVRDLTVELPLAAGWTTVVDGVSFSVGPGETLALVGESGCGKTVTALSVLGLIPGGGRIARGSVDFGGTDLATADPSRLAALRGSEIAFISQEPMVSLDPSFTVGNQLVESIRTHEGGSTAAARIRMIELLTLVGLPEPEAVAAKYPHQISGGMAQRVVIARALAGRPSLLIADEPTTALDATVQAGILELLRSLQRELGMAMILVTHDWGVVADIATRAVVMYAGQAVEYAAVEDVFTRPAHPYTFGLLQADPHLAVEGQRIRTIEGTVPPPPSWPVGCRFAGRCFLRTDACDASPIPLTVTGDARRARCLHTDRILQTTGAIS